MERSECETMEKDREGEEGKEEERKPWNAQLIPWHLDTVFTLQVLPR